MILREKGKGFGMLLLVGWLAGCGVQFPAEYPLAAEPVGKSLPVAAGQLPAEAQQEIQGLLKGYFGTPGEPKAPAESGLTAAGLANGAVLYREHCMHCHGLAGDGNGPTAPYLFPRPRDYRAGVFKFTSTDGVGTKPARSDLRRTIDQGMFGTAMPSFVVLPEAQRESLIDYVIHLSMRGELEGLLAYASKEDGYSGEELKDEAEALVGVVVDSWKQAGGKVVTAAVPEPPVTSESIQRGRELFLSEDKQCTACHGTSGMGDGPSAEKDPKTGEEMRDAWGDAVPPANLKRGIYRGGRTPQDLYWRIHIGIKGTPMPTLAPAFAENPEDIWHVVHFVQALPYLDLLEGSASQAPAHAEEH